MIRGITPRNPVQRHYKQLLDNPKVPIIVSTGPAGTGKTLLACHTGAQHLASGKVARLILTRPAVSVDEQHGFLPGTLEQKMDPWVRPMWDALGTYFSMKTINNMMSDRIIEICPLAYMRGRTFDAAWIIADEMQNATPNQMRMVLTRIGNNSKLIVAGDPDQYDKGFDLNGIGDLTDRLSKSNLNSIQIVQFGPEHVERHPVIKDVLAIYNNVV